jgi:hypothetical protein
MSVSGPDSFSSILTNRKRKEQAGAELCQAQVKLGEPASSLSLPFKISLFLKIFFKHFDKLSLSSNFSKLIQVVFQ